MSSDTDQNIQAYWYGFESRCLTMPDGSVRMFRQQRIYWGSYDFLIENLCTEERMIEILVEGSTEAGRNIDEYFGDCVAWMEREYHYIHGELY